MHYFLPFLFFSDHKPLSSTKYSTDPHSAFSSLPAVSDFTCSSVKISFASIANFGSVYTSPPTAIHQLSGSSAHPCSAFRYHRCHFFKRQAAHALNASSLGLICLYLTADPVCPVFKSFPCFCRDKENLCLWI